MKTSSLKLLVFSITVVFIFGLLVMRALDLQYVQGSELLNKAEDNRFYTLSMPANRGVILDRYGQILAGNTRLYYQLKTNQGLYNQETLVSSQAGLLLMATDSAHVKRSSERIYPLAEVAAHVVGYVSQVTAEELARDPDLDRTRDVGKVGLESAYDTLLQGQPGRELYEINALGQRERRVKAQPPVDGQNLVTTLDPNLSQLAYDSLGDVKGTVLILDASNSAVLSLVSRPSFDPNVMAHKPVDEQEQQFRQQSVYNWTQDERLPFFNRAIGGAYPPGSVFKMVTALAGLELGKLDASTTVLDEGILKVGDFEYANWYYTQYGRTEGEISLVRALARSNDIYFYKAAEWVGPTALAQLARQIGFGQEVGLGIGREATGLVPDPAWKERQIGEQWYLGNTYHYGIGQGDLTVSAAQLAKMTQGLVNHGTQCQPHVVSYQGEKRVEVDCYELGLSEDNLDIVLDGMFAACSAGGTAYTFFPYNLRHGSEDAAELSPAQKFNQGMVACKTGTAEFGAADERGYRPTHAWFVAAVHPPISEEVDDWRATLPDKLVFVVLVESDEQKKFREGSQDAAPVVTRIIEALEEVEDEVGLDTAAATESAELGQDLETGETTSETVVESE